MCHIKLLVSLQVQLFFSDGVKARAPKAKAIGIKAKDLTSKAKAVASRTSSLDMMKPGCSRGGTSPIV